MQKNTKLIHFESPINDPYNANSTPIYQTATFELESASCHTKYDYSRSANPTRDVASVAIANIENAKYARAYSSGMAAINGVLGLLKSGDHLILGDDIYGGTYRIATQRLITHRGIEVSFIDLTNHQLIKNTIKPNTKMILVETPSNPLQKIADLQHIGTLSKTHNLLFVVDNSFMSPWLQQPFNFGANVVIHSATKFLSGHSDVSGGFAITNDEKLDQELGFILNAEGLALAPLDSWLILRGIKTLGLRIERQQQNALALIKYLQQNPLITKIYYPTLDTHPQHEIHKKQASGGGSLICVETRDIATSIKLVEKTKLFNTSVSFGSIHSSISLPSNMSHQSIPKDKQIIPPTLVRLSIGIEDVEDLINDIENSLT